MTPPPIKRGSTTQWRQLFEKITSGERYFDIFTNERCHLSKDSTIYAFTRTRTKVIDLTIQFQLPKKVCRDISNIKATEGATVQQSEDELTA